MSTPLSGCRLQGMSTPHFLYPSVRGDGGRARSMPAAVLALVAVVAAVVVAVWLGVAGGRVDALHAAGVVGKMPAGGEQFKTLIDGLNANLMWVFVSCVGLAVSVGGTLMVVGHTRATDHVIRVGGGIAIILIVAPAIVA